MAAPVQRSQEHDFDRDAEKRHWNRRQQESKPETVRQLENTQPDKGAKHEKRAVCEADDIHQSEDERETRRHQKQQRTVDQPIQELGDQGLHRPFNSPRRVTVETSRQYCLDPGSFTSFTVASTALPMRPPSSSAHLQM